MIEEFQGLENKLGGVVAIGSLLLLQTKGGEPVVGFVKHVDPKIVKLSHESPANSRAYYVSTSPLNELSKRDTVYQLKNFTTYRVIDTNPTSN